ncbi:MAG: hypothetical protein QOF70_5410 [Acetobacteraceae bacterium]|nr:hypothetical protein [Acetobacteraceae bacterium]
MCGGSPLSLCRSNDRVTPAHHHRGQERGLPKSHRGDEKGWRALAPVTAKTGEIPVQYRGARPPERETADPPRPRLRWLLDGPTNTGRLRGDGYDEEGAGSEHRRQRHQGPGNVHRRTISSRRLRSELGPLADGPRPNPKRCNRTDMVAIGSRLAEEEWSVRSEAAWPSLQDFACSLDQWPLVLTVTPTYFRRPCWSNTTPLAL